MKENTTINKMELVNYAVLGEISKILGNELLTVAEVELLLRQCKIADVAPNEAKWKRLLYAFENNQSENECSDDIFGFIKQALFPAKFVDAPEFFSEMRKLINQQLSFVGYQFGEDGEFSQIKQAKTISEAQRRADDLKTKLEQQGAHKAIFRYCKAELVANNYFHSVFEANKGLLERIRELSSCNEDGSRLIEFVFSDNPVLTINKYQSQSEISEHRGFRNILKGLCGMFRNPEAHEPKISWTVTEQDALEILSMISYCHRRLEYAEKTRQV